MNSTTDHDGDPGPGGTIEPDPVTSDARVEGNRVRVEESTVSGDIAGRDKIHNETHNHFAGAVRDPWRIVAVSNLDLRFNAAVYVDLTRGSWRDTPGHPLVVVQGPRHSGRYAAALACARLRTRARQNAGSAIKSRVLRIDDIVGRFDVSVEQVCGSRRNAVVIVRDVDRENNVGGHLTPDDWDSLLARLRGVADANECQVILTVDQAFVSKVGRRVAVEPPRWSPPETDSAHDRLRRIFARHGEIFLRRALAVTEEQRSLVRVSARALPGPRGAGSAPHGRLDAALGWLEQQRARPLAHGRVVAPGRVAAMWDRFGSAFMRDEWPSAEDIETALGGRAAQRAWFEKQPFAARVALVLVWLFEGLGVAELIESAAAVAAQASEALHEGAHATWDGQAESLATLSRCLLTVEQLERLQIYRPTGSSRICFRDPALGDAVAEQARDYGFLIGPLARALPATLHASRQAVTPWREAFGRAIGKLGAHRSAELKEHLHALWQAGQIVELREALRELCRSGRHGAGDGIAFLKSHDRLSHPDGIYLALHVLPALSSSGDASEADNEGPLGGSDPALQLACDIETRIDAAQRTLPLRVFTRMRARLIQVLNELVRSRLREAATLLRDGILTSERGDVRRPSDSFLRLLARAVARALPAALYSDPNEGRELLADLLRSDTANRLAREAVRHMLIELARNAGGEAEDPARRLLHDLAWHRDMRVIHGLRCHLADGRAYLAANPRALTRDLATELLIVTAREADAAAGLVLRSTRGRLVLAGRFAGSDAKDWRDRVVAWMAPYARVDLADARDLDGVRAALDDAIIAPPPAGAARGAPDCPLVYLALDAETDTDALELSRVALAIGPHVPTGRAHVERVRLEWNAPGDVRHAAFNAVLAWWTRHADARVQDGTWTEDGSTRIRRVVELSRIGSTGEPSLRELVHQLAHGSTSEQVDARAALLRRCWHAAGASSGERELLSRRTRLAQEWRRLREALSELPQRLWDMMWRDARESGAPQVYVAPSGARRAAVVVRLRDADDSCSLDDAAAKSDRVGRPSDAVLACVERGLGERGLEVQVCDEMAQRRAAPRRSIEHLIDPIRASECSVVVLLGGYASMNDRLLDLEDWRASLGNRLVAVDLPATLARLSSQFHHHDRRAGAGTRAASCAGSVAAEILQRVERQLALRSPADRRPHAA